MVEEVGGRSICWWWMRWRQTGMGLVEAGGFYESALRFQCPQRIVDTPANTSESDKLPIPATGSLATLLLDRHFKLATLSRFEGSNQQPPKDRG